MSLSPVEKRIMRKVIMIALMITASATAQAADTTVTETNTGFDLTSAVLRAGDVMTFVNKDTVSHDLQIVNSDGDVEDTGQQKPGQNIKHRFDLAGTYKVRCAIHPQM